MRTIKPSRAIVCMRLYRVFGLKEEDYATTVKLLYIYDWVEPQAGDVSIDVIIALRKYFRRESNRRSIDALYNELKLISINTSQKYDTHTLHVPMNMHTTYILGHKV